LKTIGVRGVELEPELAIEVREIEPKELEKKDDIERGVEGMLGIRLHGKIEQLEQGVWSGSNATISEIDEIRDVVLDEAIVVVEGLEDGFLVAARRLVARRWRRKRRSWSKAFSDFQVLGRSSGSFSN